MRVLRVAIQQDVAAVYLGLALDWFLGVPDEARLQHLLMYAGAR